MDGRRLRAKVAGSGGEKRRDPIGAAGAWQGFGPRGIASPAVISTGAPDVIRGVAEKSFRYGASAPASRGRDMGLVRKGWRRRAKDRESVSTDKAAVPPPLWGKGIRSAPGGDRATIRRSPGDLAQVRALTCRTAAPHMRHRRPARKPGAGASRLYLAAACRRTRLWCGAVAQMGERRVRNAKVRGSIPLGSTKPRRRNIFCELPARRVVRMTA